MRKKFSRIENLSRNKFEVYFKSEDIFRSFRLYFLKCVKKLVYCDQNISFRWTRYYFCEWEFLFFFAGYVFAKKSLVSPKLKKPKSSYENSKNIFSNFNSHGSWQKKTVNEVIDINLIICLLVVASSQYHRKLLTK